MFKRRALAVVAMAVVACAAVTPWLVSAQPVEADAVVSGLASTSTEFSVSSPEADVADLTLTALAPITIGGVTTTIMEFTMSAATMRGMKLDGACRSSSAIESSVAAPHTATLTGSVLLDLTGLTFTLGGTTYTFTPDAPPPAGFSLPSATLTDVTFNGVNLQAKNATLQDLSTKFVDC